MRKNNTPQRTAQHGARENARRDTSVKRVGKRAGFVAKKRLEEREDGEYKARREVPKGRETEKKKIKGKEIKRKDVKEREARPGREFALREIKAKEPGRLKKRGGKEKNDEGIRLNKFIANGGICSRREADTYISTGLITINDKLVTELGTKVMPGDVVKFNGETIGNERKVYIVMNKPKDFVTTVSDPYAKNTVLGLVRGKCSARVYPVGRLDKATTGVLLLTNDGDLAEKLLHPSFEKKKIYHVFLDKRVKATDMAALLNGIELEDGFIKADNVSYVDNDETQVGVEIHSGRNRIIRRMFEHLDYKIKKLDRVYFAGLTKKNLRRGQWRFLTDKEVNMLKMGSYE